MPLPAWADCLVARKPITCHACHQPTPRRIAPGRLCIDCGHPFWPKSPDPAYRQCDPCYRGYAPPEEWPYELA